MLGGLGVYRVIVTIVNSKRYLAMEAHISEIRTLLRYNNAVTNRMLEEEDRIRAKTF